MIVPETNTVRERQSLLMRKYRTEPADALITDRAITFDGNRTDPFHGFVRMGRDELETVQAFGIHHAVGGYHDLPNPGDLLCGALAACLDSTLRIIAERMRIPILKLEIEVTATVDVRGTLCIERHVPVGFQQMQSKIILEVPPQVLPSTKQRLVEAAEHCCVNLQTLLKDINIKTTMI